MQAWKVHKFGGSSVADAACMERVARIIENDPAPRKAVVLSACRGVTDALLGLIGLAEQGSAELDDRLLELRQRHVGIARELLAGEACDDYIDLLETDCRDIGGILQTIRLVRSASTTMRDLISGYGEIWSTRLFERLLRRRAARPRAVARRAQGAWWWSGARSAPACSWEQSRAQLQALVASDFVGTLVITGFIATDTHGLQTTLGRNGSDFSASIFGALLDAAEIHHLDRRRRRAVSADPRRVPEAQVIDSLSYNEAMELAYFGAKVIHPQTMAPAVRPRIPIWIRNTFAPDQPGTLICATAPSPIRWSRASPPSRTSRWSTSRAPA